MISQERRDKIRQALCKLARIECADMFERYQILAEHIYPILVKDDQTSYDVATLHKKLAEMDLEEFHECGLVEDDIIFALAFLLYGNDVDCHEGKFFARRFY